MASLSEDISVFRGIETMRKETMLLKERMKAAYSKSAIEAYGQPSTPGLGVYVYGSAGREEMVGGDADADVFILEYNPSEKGRKFRELFVKEMNKFEYSKLDLPEWGTLDEAETFLRRSLIEGNQILETKYVQGDGDLNQRLEGFKREYNTLERAIKNFVFNRFYLDEYFKNKIRDGTLNVKYCEGGSRELLFFSWYNDIISLLNGYRSKENNLPRCLIGAKKALLRQRINEEEYAAFIKSVDYITVLRSDILAVNKDTIDRGLSFLDSKTINRLLTLDYTSEDSVHASFENNRGVIRTLVNRLYEDVISIMENRFGADWGRNFKRAINPRLSSKERLEISGFDPIMQMAKIWGANSSNQGECFSQLSREYISSRDSGVIGSLVNSKLCPPDVLDCFGRGIGRERGYGYLLRVIARNPNTPKETLMEIVNDKNLEERYTAVAKAVLKEGINGAHNQI